MRSPIILVAIALATSLQAQTITEYRWWLNDDLSTLTNVAVSAGADLQLSTDIDLPTLVKDHNYITIQFKDSDGGYSSPITRMFTRSTGMVNGHEYWIDDDIANSTSGPIGPATVVDLIADLPTNMTAGDHTFTIRFSGESGTWSVPHSTTFSVITSIGEINGIDEVVVFPNPVTDQLCIRISATGARTLDMEILDLSGRSIQRSARWNVIGTDRYFFNVGALSQGEYILQLSDGTGRSTISFTKY